LQISSSYLFFLVSLVIHLGSSKISKKLSHTYLSHSGLFIFSCKTGSSDELYEFVSVESKIAELCDFGTIIHFSALFCAIVKNISDFVEFIIFGIEFIHQIFSNFQF
jgi:hypothetical protein